MANARAELLMKMTHHLDAQGSVIFGVFTLPLRRGHDLSYRYKNLNLVMERFRRGIKKLEKRLGIIYSSRYLDEAWGEKYGWNPHFNWVFFLPHNVDESDVKKFMDAARQLWVHCALQGGLRGVSPLSQSLEWVLNTDRAKQVAGYVTHHSYYPLKLDTSVLRSEGKWRGLLPFEVLEVALTIDSRVRSAWLEFERASKGRHRVYHYSNLPRTSPGRKRPAISLQEVGDDDFQ